MLKNYFVVTFRNIKKYKLYSFINIGGLSIGLACTLMIILWVKDELSYDKSFKDAPIIYRANWDFKWNNNEGVGPGTPPPLAKSLLSDIPEISSATRVFTMSTMTVRYGDKFFNESRIFGVDPNFFSFFDYKFQKGNPLTALSEPNCIVLIEDMSRKYFGDESPIGKIVTIGENRVFAGKTYNNAFKVTGVIKNPPSNSHIRFDMLASINSNPEVLFFDWSWIWMQVVTYVKINDPSNVAVLESKVPAMVKKYAPAAFKRVGFSYDEMIKSGGRWNFVFQPLSDIYLGSGEIGNRLGPVGNKMYIYIFSIIAVFILLIACINFMNLATARSETRLREVGMRKVLGSTRKMLAWQFISESVVLSFISMFLAVLIAALFIAPFNNLTDKSLTLVSGNPFFFFGSLLLLALTVGFISGSYPAFYLSSFKPVVVLKGNVRKEVRSKNYRSLLVAFQFIITIGLIVATILINEQINYVQNKDIGFNKENLLVISNENSRLGNKAEAFKNDLLNYPGIISASLSTGVPPNYGFQDFYKVEGKGEEQVDLISYMTDESFIKTMGIEITKGRGFSKEFSADSANVIINETAVKSFGWKEPIGKIITYPSVGRYTIIGVMKDFNFMSLYSPVQPFVLFHESSKSYKISISFVIVRVAGNNLKSTIDFLKSKWNEFVPGTPFEFNFLDDNLNAEYLSVLRLEKIFFIFILLTIFIAAVGLFGLVSFSTEKRTKEVGIRKVLGASAFNILSVISRDLLKPVLLANIIAWPLAYYFMNKWLEDFAYRINITWWVFVLSGGIALFIALATVSFQAIKAAMSNPVESLRYE